MIGSTVIIFVDTVIEFENGVDVDTIRKRFVDGVQAGDKSRMLVWAGSGVGLMKNIMPAQVRPWGLYSSVYFLYMAAHRQTTS